jgi:hypothetical protein
MTGGVGLLADPETAMVIQALVLQARGFQVGMVPLAREEVLQRRPIRRGVSRPRCPERVPTTVVILTPGGGHLVGPEM